MPTRYRIDTPLQLTGYVRALRKARGETQTDVAKQLGVSTMRVATIEKDIGRVSARQLLNLLHLLGAHLELEASDRAPGHPSRQVAERKSKKGKATNRRRTGEW